MLKQCILMGVVLVVSISLVKSSRTNRTARFKRGAGAGFCNGGRNTYKFFCYPPIKPAARVANVVACFDWLINSSGGSDGHHGCYTHKVGSCMCTVDSPYIGSYGKTFKEARDNLHRQCGGYRHNIMERYEGNMYLAATCY